MKKQARIELECDNCGKKVLRLRNAINEHNFCRIECYWEWMKGKKTGRWIYEESFEEERTCPICGDSFVVTGINRDQKYCSRKCYHRDPKIRAKRSKFMSSENAPQKQPETQNKIRKSVEKIWEERKREGKPYGHQGMKHTRDTRLRIALIKTLQVIWRGGQIGDYGAFWGIAREDALKRDGHVCVVCGKTTALVVHHIIPLKLGGTHDIDNLMTLCHSCHGKLEGKMDELAQESMQLVEII